MFNELCKIIDNNRITAIARMLLAPSRKYMYDWIALVTPTISDGKIAERLHWILGNVHRYPKCAHPDCKCDVNSDQFISISIGYAPYCSHKCMQSSPIIAEKRRMTNNAKSYEQKQMEIAKRIATYNKHKEEDPEFVKRKQEKSVATRKKNHGEDYTGRKKCWNTMKEKYGVSNPMQIKDVQDHIKQHNLETYGVEWHIAAKEIREKSK